MEYGLIILWILILIAGICFLTRDQKTIRQQREQIIQCKNYQVTAEELEVARNELVRAQANVAQAQQEYASLSTTLETTKQDVKAFTKEYNHLQELIGIQKTRLEDDLVATRQAKEAELKQQLDAEERTNAAAILQAKSNAEKAIAKYQAELDAAQAKYFAVLEVLNQNENNEESHKLHISEAARADIEYLLNAVALRLNNPNTIYKLIWSEYIQDPATDLLNNILPAKDCSGIYKITDCENKKCYIGRSTSVRKRLQEHIKSSIGIENIASQRIHEVMREKGLWNFRFELLEECTKDQLGEREKYYIDFFDSQTLGYNQVSGSAYKDKGV